MGFFSTLFGGRQLSPEEEKQEQEAKKFDLLKYDGVKAMKMGQADYAVRCFTEALKVHDDLEVHDYLSQVLLRQGNLDAAMNELRTLGDAEPENAQIQIRMAQVAYMQEDYATMETVCQQATTLEPENAEPYFLHAQAMKGQQNPVGAIAMLTKAISLKEDYAEAYLLRGQTLLAMGDAASAETDADWLLEHVGDHEDVLLLKDGFGVPPEDLLEVNPSSLEDVVTASRRAEAFCRAGGGSGRLASHLALCIEEMGSNIVSHGFTAGKENHVSIRLLHKGGAWTLRFRDDCMEFDPIRHVSEGIENDSVGIRLAMRMADEARYTYSMNLNNLMLILKEPD